MGDLDRRLRWNSRTDKVRRFALLFLHLGQGFSAKEEPFEGRLSLESDMLSFRFLVGQGCIKPLCDLLPCPDKELVHACLESLDHILRVGKAEGKAGSAGGANAFAQMIEDLEGLEEIENLQIDSNPLVYQKTVEILDAYWRDDHDGDDSMAT